MKLIKRILAWHKANRDYDGFTGMELGFFITIGLLIINLSLRSTDLFDWLLLFYWLQYALMMGDKFVIYKRHDNLLSMIAKTQAEDIHDLHVTRRYLRAANRRRKRAEKRLRKLLNRKY